ncbi:hypothetical protein [Halobacillus seohaensis]|uniref:Lipoprotein n=1 Tax=Halobacillus seohaensis TaxID=447421 RepID=A0ABW2ENA1_9BACI
MKSIVRVFFTMLLLVGCGQNESTTQSAENPNPNNTNVVIKTYEIQGSSEQAAPCGICSNNTI